MEYNEFMDKYGIKDTNLDPMEFQGIDWKEASVKTWLEFCKANATFKEPGISYDELRALYEAMETLGPRPIVSLETGQCFGTTTRFFTIRKIKYGGEHYSCEIKIRELFTETMKKLGLYGHYTTLGDSMKCPWDPEKMIDFLFIDSEHAFSNALGEYMRYRVFLRDGGIVGFHDTESCIGVSEAIKQIHRVDKLEFVSRSGDRASAGIIFFRMKAHGVNEFRERMAAGGKDWGGYDILGNRAEAESEGVDHETITSS